MKTKIQYPQAPKPIPFERRVTQLPSPIGDHRAEAYIYMPESEPKTQVYFVHDVNDNKVRYQHFAETLVGYGHAVTLFDLRGHGRSPVDGQYGYFAANEGWERQIRDMATIFARNAQVNHPTILIGSGIGALFVLSYLKRNPSQISGAILLGPYTKWPGLNWAKTVTGVTSFFDPIGKGIRFQRKFNDALNANIPSPETDYDWLSTIRREVEAYLATEHCGEPLCKRGYYDLTLLQSDIYSTSLWQITQRRLPIHIYYGGQDPVESLTHRGGESLVRHLRQVGYSETELFSIPRSRHDLLFDVDADAIFDEIVAFCEARAQAVPRK